ncbi:SPFH domain-containing protein [Microbispora sp. H13382]|uniref:SPFH domain-containing protein n=1 Tax=Microbispora sp. H13382 TaxID=2729112 RepID=UPI001C727773
MSSSRRRLGIAIVRQYERGVVFRLGRVRDVRDPGVRFMIPMVDRGRWASARNRGGGRGAVRRIRG